MISHSSHQTSVRLILLGLISLVSCSGCLGSADRYDTERLYAKAETTPAPEARAELTAVPPESPPLALPLSREADGTVSLSLEDSVALTLRRNRELQAELYGPLIAGTFTQLERGIFDPELFAEIGYAEETASETSRSTEEQFNVEGEETRVGGGIRQTLPTGTELTARTDYGRTLSNRTPEQQEVRLGLSVTQSLLRGLGPAVNLVAVRQAELGARASRYELRGYIEALVAETETAYWRYVLAGEGIAIFENSLEIAQQQLTEVENRIEVGVIPRNSAAAARTEVARREQALIEARSIFNERRLRLLRLLNLDLDRAPAERLRPTSSPHLAAPPLEDLDLRQQLAVKMRPDLGEARLRLRQDRLEVVRTRNGLLPRLELFMELGKSGYAESFGEAWSTLDEESYDLSAGLRFSSALGNRQASARHRAALATTRQAEAALQNLEQLIRLDVLLAANEVERTRQQISASRSTRLLQEQTLEAEQQRFEVGDVTSLLVAQAQRDLLVSQLNEIEAVVAYRIALVELYLAEGSLLDRRGITLSLSSWRDNPRVDSP